MLKNLRSLIIIGIALCLVACATSTQTANVLPNTLNTVETVSNIGAVAVGQVPLVVYSGEKNKKTAHQITINGKVYCKDIQFNNFNNLKIEIFDQNKLVSSRDIDSSGSFSLIYSSSEGLHAVHLVDSRNSKILDSTEFKSSKAVDRFEVVLNSCKSK